MLLLEQVDQVRRSPHADEALHGVEHDIELALGHRGIRGYEWEPLNLTHQPAGAVACSRPHVQKKHGGTLPPCFCGCRSRRPQALDPIRYSGLLMPDLRRLRS